MLKYRRIILGSLLVGFVSVLSFRVTAEDASEKISQEPVEADVHEFMEYAFEPFFHALRDSISSEPKDKKAWVPVKSNSLVLAENGNLLMLRPPKENVDSWNRLAADVRDTGKQLYNAAKKRDYELTRKHYLVFVEKCNACHDQFADGEHQQKP